MVRKLEDFSFAEFCEVVRQTPPGKIVEREQSYHIREGNFMLVTSAHYNPSGTTYLLTIIKRPDSKVFHCYDSDTAEDNSDAIKKLYQDTKRRVNKAKRRQLETGERSEDDLTMAEL